MFNEIDKKTTAPAVDDIFAETDSAHVSSTEANIEAQPAGLSAGGGGTEDKGHGGPKIKMLLIFLLAAIILGAAAYLVYSKFIQADDEALSDVNENIYQSTTTVKTTVTATDVVVPVPEDIVPTTTPAADIETTTEPVAVTPTAPIDSDGDSLTDNEELTLGTNANLIDSDFDGLSDYEEVRVYGTNPLNPDSDGDTFKDGDEVKNGYNPKGEGKLQ